MGDRTTLAKARMELEELYQGIPDDSVNLTFQDFANVTSTKKPPSEKKKPIASSSAATTTTTTTMEPIPEANTPRRESALNKLPSLDFSRGLQESIEYQHHHHHHGHGHGHGHHGHHNLGHISELDDTIDPHSMTHHRHHHHVSRGHGHGHDHHGSTRNHRTVSPRSGSDFRNGIEGSVAYDNVSVMSMASTYQERGQRRRPGIPHSNICTICSTYIYIFRHRCLVCGRAYCRQCVIIGMGEMTEGRKCIQCLGKRFSQRYIQRAGKVGCCSRYPSMVKQAELKWAEKGPRRSVERGLGGGQSAIMARSRSPVTPRSPTGAYSGSNTPSFAATSPYSPYTTSHHHLPL